MVERSAQRYFPCMCNAYNLRHRNDAILDIARAMQLPLLDLPDFPPRHRIGIKQRGLILRPDTDGALAWSWARWSLIPPRSRQVPPYPLNNTRSDKLGSWPLNAVQRQRCLVPASGFWEPEKPARAKGVASWSYYSMADGRPFFMAGLWSDAPDPATGEVSDSYTVIITDANAAIRVHDRMPAILATEAARQWVEPGPLPPELLAPFPAEAMTAWRVGDDARNSRIEPYAGMAEPVASI
jgi:putative SOS response-associated peptidase YedK